MLIVLALPGCSEATAPAVVPPPVEAPAPAPETAAAPEPEHPKACALVTQEEMSKILGAKMVAEGNGGSTQTECFYKAAKGSGPTVEFSVNWGSGHGGMNMASMLAAAKPEMASVHQGIGDQATMVGTSLMIRSGEDLVILVMSDVQDASAKAKRIFDTAKARM